jgi:hypothetical protein
VLQGKQAIGPRSPGPSTASDTQQPLFQKKKPLTKKASRTVEVSGIRKWGNLKANTDETATRLTPIIVPHNNAVRSVFILNEEILHAATSKAIC